MCDRCAMPSPSLPAVSLRTAHCLPAGKVLLWVPSYLIYIILWSIRRVICGVEANFLLALRDGRSLEPRSVAVDVVGPRPSGALHDLAARTRCHRGTKPFCGGTQGEEAAEEGERQGGADDHHHRDHTVPRQEAEQQGAECGDRHLHKPQEPRGGTGDPRMDAEPSGDTRRLAHA